MKSEIRSICLVVGNLTERTLRLQPWRYLHEVAKQLIVQGYNVTIISDGSPALPVDDQIDNVPVVRLPAVNNPRWSKNVDLQQQLETLAPDLILLNLGLPSFAHQQFRGWPAPIVGIFPGLVYSIQDLTRLGLKRIVKGHHLSAIHVAGTLMPKQFVRSTLRKGLLHSIVVQTETTCRGLVDNGVAQADVHVIAPGVDEAWKTDEFNHNNEVRAKLGYKSDDAVVLFFGSPAPLRGLHTLIKAVEIARRTEPSLKLMILNRRRADELLNEDADLKALLSRSTIKPHVEIVSGFLPEDLLVRHVAACDIVSLPFELIPADAPLSLLEAHALGKPVVTTKVGCLPELVADGVHYLANPADATSLAQELCKAVQDLSAPHALGMNGSNGTTKKIYARSWHQVGVEWSHFLQNLPRN